MHPSRKFYNHLGRKRTEKERTIKTNIFIDYSFGTFLANKLFKSKYKFIFQNFPSKI